MPIATKRQKSWIAKELMEARMYEPRLFTDARRELDSGSIAGVSREELAGEYIKLSTTLRVGAGLTAAFLAEAAYGTMHGRGILVDFGSILVVGTVNPMWITVCHRATARKQMAQYDEIAASRKGLVDELAGQRRNA